MEEKRECWAAYLGAFKNVAIVFSFVVNLVLAISLGSELDPLGLSLSLGVVGILAALVGLAASSRLGTAGRRMDSGAGKESS